MIGITQSVYRPTEHGEPLFIPEEDSDPLGAFRGLFWGFVLYAAIAVGLIFGWMIGALI